ncbi:hypothetical protein NEFER03_0708 [Nematocida sp. LUAm3]|nr:hypothetical protein NEFER03_0708 [Nematocida sp. LUAm3]KAI5175167.1 hypothetical protein NEFER02_1128 [Nematocida sp. LUAm2]KAI5178161.1 hypothetical protein NEFER01_1339 [Nematocida sp. LUAm1]
MLSKRIGPMNTEHTRYILGRVCGGIGLSLGIKSTSALIHMHSARIFLTLSEIEERWKYFHVSSLECAETSVLALKALSSSLMVLLGYSKLSRILELTYLTTESLLSAYRVYLLSNAYINIKKKSKPTEKVQKLLVKGSVSLLCSVLDAFSVSLHLWKLFLLSGAIHAISITYSYYGNLVQSLNTYFLNSFIK